MNRLNRPALIAELDRLGHEDDATALEAARAAARMVAEDGARWDELLAVPAEESPLADNVEDAPVTNGVASTPVGEMSDEMLLGQLLDRGDLSAELRAELVDLDGDRRAGELTEMDRRYLQALAGRLGTSG